MPSRKTGRKAGYVGGPFGPFIQEFVTYLKEAGLGQSQIWKLGRVAKEVLIWLPSSSRRGSCWWRSCRRRRCSSPTWPAPLIPVPVAHGEGRAVFADPGDVDRVEGAGLVVLRYVTPAGDVASRYPDNPNGSANAITGLTTRDGRVTILMPHPERVFRTVQNSWHPREWGEDGPWLRMFRNARRWID